MGAKEFIAELQQEAVARKKAQQDRVLQIVTRYTGRHIWIGGKKYLNFAANDYLGLASDKTMQERLQPYLQEGTGNCSSRLLVGNSAIYIKLEERLARWKAMERALVVSSGYALNVAIMQTLLCRKRPAMFLLDRHVHASIIDGVKLAGGQFMRYQHNDLSHLERLLKRYQAKKMHMIVATEAVFSMDGDLASLKEIIALTAAYDALCYIDEAHAVGIFGEAGEGFSRLLKFKNFTHILAVGTFGKSLGVSGAYIACADVFYQHFIQTLRSLIYSTALTPLVLASVYEALKLISNEDPNDNVSIAYKNRGKLLLATAARWRKRLQMGGIDTSNSAAPIIPVMVGDNDTALALAAYLRKKGIWAPAIRPPTVPRGSSRIRLTLNSLLLPADLDYAAECLFTFYRKNLKT